MTSRSADLGRVRPEYALPAVADATSRRPLHIGGDAESARPGATVDRFHR